LARADVLPDFRLAPIEQRAHFVEAVLRVPLYRLRLRARRRLLPAHACHPGGVALDGALEGLDLAHVAAGEARIQAVVEAVDALACDQLLQRLRVRIDQVQR